MQDTYLTLSMRLCTYIPMVQNVDCLLVHTRSYDSLIGCADETWSHLSRIEVVFAIY